MPCQIIAEVGLAHDGSLGIAHSYIDAIAKTGASAVKFQTHIAHAESTTREPWRRKFAVEDTTRFDYWQRTGFAEHQWRDLRDHAERVGLRFLSSPFSVEAVDLLERIGVGAWKLPSGELNNPSLIDRLLATRLPVIASTGFATTQEIDRAVQQFKAVGADLTLMQCTSMYPTPPEKVGLNMLSEFRERYGCRVGLSDHSGAVYAGLAAAALGADAIEVHVTFSREMFGPDAIASLVMEELRQLVQGVAFIETALAHPVGKDSVATTLEPLRQIFTKSLVARHDLAAGITLREQDLAAKKPGSGIPVAEMPELVGRRLRRALLANEPLAREDVE